MQTFTAQFSLLQTFTAGIRCKLLLPFFVVQTFAAFLRSADFCCHKCRLLLPFFAGEDPVLSSQVQPLCCPFFISGEDPCCRRCRLLLLLPGRLLSLPSEGGAKTLAVFLGADYRCRRYKFSLPFLACRLLPSATKAQCTLVNLRLKSGEVASSRWFHIILITFPTVGLPFIRPT